MNFRNLFLLLLALVVGLGAYLLLREPPKPVQTGLESAQGAEPIVLLHEAQAVVARADDEPPKTPVLAHGVATISSTLCRRLGPFDTHDAATSLANRIETLVQRARIDEEVERRRLGFWVIIPQQSTRQAAERILQQLRQTGEKDVWLFRSGELENGLSLGLFAERDNAEKRREAIVAKGFRAELRPRFREFTDYWLDVELRPDAEDLEAWLTRNTAAIVDSQVVDCPRQAADLE